MKILWPKRETEDIESALQNIEHQKLVAVYFDKGGGKQESEQEITHPLAVGVIPAARLLREDPGPFSLFADGGDGIPEALVFFAHFRSLS